MSERGSIELMAIAGLVLAVVLGGLTLAAKTYKSQRDEARLALQVFKKEVAQKGIEAQRQAEVKDRDNAIVLAKQARIVAKLTERAVYAERILRARPPARPDGSTVSTTTCDKGGAPDAARELVPLEEYRALELRALRDTDKCNALQNAVKELISKGLMRVEP